MFLKPLIKIIVYNAKYVEAKININKFFVKKLLIQLAQNKLKLKMSLDIGFIS